MNNNVIACKSKIKSALLVCSFLCGSEGQCMENGSVPALRGDNAEPKPLSAPELATSLEQAFNGTNKPVDVILVSRAGGLQSYQNCMPLDEIALVFACLAVNLGGNKKEIRTKLDCKLKEFEYMEKCPYISWYLKEEYPVPNILRVRDDYKQYRINEILSRFDQYCSQLPSSEQDNSWKIVIFNEMFFSKTLVLQKAEVDKIKELFFDFVTNKELIVYLNFLYQDMVEISREEFERIYDTIDGEVQFNYRTMKPISSPKFLFTPFENSSLENYLKNKKFADLYKQRLDCTWSKWDSKLSCVLNRTAAYYQNEQLSHYDKSSYCRECTNFLGSWENMQINYPYIYYVGAGKDIVDSAKYEQLANIVVNNISSEICYDHGLGIREKNNWNNGKQRSKLHILVSNFISTTDSNNFPQDIVTACVDPFGIPARKSGENKAITGVFKADQVFPYTTYHFTYAPAKCRYGIMVVKDIFKQGKGPQQDNLDGLDN